jgi:hypothetical protein
MGIFEKLYFRMNGNARDVTDLFSPLLLKEGYHLKVSKKHERHIVYSNGKIDFDFWWVKGNRPTLFIRDSGEMIRTDIYDKLIQKHGAKNAHLGKISHYIYSKLDKDLYFEEHYRFVSDYIKRS